MEIVSQINYFKPDVKFDKIILFKKKLFLKVFRENVFVNPYKIIKNGNSKMDDDESESNWDSNVI